jgi:NAD(P)-dependent dehydrogenase (short-subunit alcohol dehydrogenase family)
MGRRELGRRPFMQALALAAVGAVACRGKGEDAPRARVEPAARGEPRMLEGKTCLVTGATSGMGAVTAMELARLGATVLVAGRDRDRTEEHAAAIRRATGARAAAVVADLASRDQVRAMADEIARQLVRLDVLVNNAGTVLFERTVTADGLEKTFAVNYLSHFLLTNLLLDRLRASPSARIVNVSSVQHHDGRIDFANLQGERHYDRLDAYARSKLAVLMFTYELARRLEGSRVTVNAVHPGTVASNLGDENGFVRGWLRVRLRNVMRRGSWMSAEEGARNIVHVASAPELDGVTGRYFDHATEARSSPASYDAAVARRLWELSAELCGLASASAAIPGGVAPQP